MRKVWSVTALLLSVVVLAAGLPAMAAQAAPRKEADEEEPTAEQWIVSQDGMGDFTTISEAAEVAGEGDTIWICPGVYEESVRIPEKELNLVGVNRDTCILRNCTEDYFTPPLEMAAGSVRNLTIWSYRSSDDPIDKSTGLRKNTRLTRDDLLVLFAEGMIPLEAFTGYAVHIDSDYSYGHSLLFDNCLMQSDCNYTVGVGLRGDFELEFRNCELIARGSAGDIYLHDSAVNFPGESKVSFLGTKFVSNLAQYALAFHSLNEENRVDLLFQGVTIDGVAYQDREIYQEDNLYTGLTVEELPQEKVQRLNLEKTQMYLKAARSLRDPFEAAQIRGDKIAYVRDTFMLNTMTWEEALRYEYKENPAYAERRRTCIYVWNKDGLPGDGWGGTKNFYLSPESSGNFLPDFNYATWAAAIAALQDEESAESAEDDFVTE